MKAQLIALENGNVLVTNDDIEKGDFFYNPDVKDVFKAEYTPFIGCKKVIASENEEHIIRCDNCKRNKKSGSIYTCSCFQLPQIDYNGFNLFLKDMIKVFDVEVKQEENNFKILEIN